VDSIASRLEPSCRGASAVTGTHGVVSDTHDDSSVRISECTSRVLRTQASSTTGGHRATSRTVRDPETILETGQAFHEPADVEVPHFDNASDDEAAVFVACYLLPPGEDRVIEMLDQ
jgi:hypothetical protein